MSVRHPVHPRPGAVSVRMPATVALVVAGLAATGGAAASSDYALTIYSPADAAPLFDGSMDFEPPPGYAIVRERRSSRIGAERGTLTLHGFPRYLDPSALSVALEHGQVLSQRFDVEPQHSERWLERSLGRQVTVEQTAGGQLNVLTGELLSASLPLTLRMDDGSVVSINDYSRIRLPAPAGGGNSTAQVRLAVQDARAGSQALTLTYPTAGLAWRAEYVLKLTAGGRCRLDFSGLAELVNRSGHDFVGASVKLVAGEPPFAGAAAIADRAGDSGSAGVHAGQQSAYPLPLPVDLVDGGSQQVALLPALRQARCSREHLYAGMPLRAIAGRVPITDPAFGIGGEQRVHHSVRFAPGHDSPLPEGRVRVLEEDLRDGTLEFAGEQSIGPVATGGWLDIGTGPAADLAGRRSVSDFRLDPAGGGMAETVRVRLRNRGEAAARVRVREHLYRWPRWRISDAEPAHVANDRDSIDFLVEVPANGEAAVSYRVRYQWTEGFQ